MNEGEYKPTHTENWLKINEEGKKKKGIEKCKRKVVKEGTYKGVGGKNYRRIRQEWTPKKRKMCCLRSYYFRVDV